MAIQPGIFGFDWVGYRVGAGVGGRTHSSFQGAGRKVLYALMAQQEMRSILDREAKAFMARELIRAAERQAVWDAEVRMRQARLCADAYSVLFAEL